MDANGPRWIDETFLAKILQKEEDRKNKVTVVNFSVRPAVGPSNNYFSHIYRVKVEYNYDKSPLSKQSLSLIVKSPITKGYFSDLSENGKYFEKELEMYRDILPKFYKKRKFAFGPNSFYSPTDRELILQDLAVEGYKVSDRLKQLDYSCCKSVFVKIAEFHATSVALYQDDPTSFGRVGEETVFSETCKRYSKPALDDFVRSVAHICKEIKGCEEFEYFLLRKVENLWASIVNICKQKATGLNVLNHGDLWANNILFKKDDLGKVTDLKFVDFQLTRYASPALDLLYFIWTSANEEVREYRLQDLYDIYLQTLNTTLEQLGCEERLTLRELKDDLKASSDLIILILCEYFPGMMRDPADAFIVEEFQSPDENSDFMSENAHVEKMLNGKVFRALLPTMIKQYRNWIT